MRATMPHVEVPGDNAETINNYGWEIRPHIMARSGTLMGLNQYAALWRFGFKKGSEAANAYGVSITETDEDKGFLWVIATRSQGKIKEMFRGYAIELPDVYRRVMEKS